MAAHRMARGRKRADEILAFDPARRHAHRRSRRHGQIALAHRARLRGTQKRTRPRPFRRAKLARLPSSRNPVHRRLWIPYPRTSGDSPLRSPAPPNISHIHPSQTPRRRRSDPNGISKTRSRQSEDNSRSRWPEPCCAARVAKPFQLDHLCDHPTEDRRDTVELANQPPFTSIFLTGFCASAILGSVTVRTPFLKLASILSASIVSGMRSARSNVPNRRSLIWKSLFFSSLSSCFSPLIVRTPSTTLTSTFFSSSPGSSAVSSNAFSFSTRSTAGAAIQDSACQNGSISNAGLRNGNLNGFMVKSSNNRSTSSRRLSNGRHACMAVGEAAGLLSIVTGTFVSAFAIRSSFFNCFQNYPRTSALH